MTERERESSSELDPSATEWNWVIVARGTEKLFRATKGFINVSGGSVKYQKLSGYLFHVEEMRPDSHEQTSTEKDGVGK